MKTPKTAHRYLVKIWYSEEDACYLAEVPALQGCVTHGRTFAEASRHVQEAMDLWIQDAAEHGEPVPEPDRAREEIDAVRQIISVAKLARRAGLNPHTLASKLRRRSRFTEAEAQGIRRALVGA
jgi:predicted RNase H-like HicB family nuclease